jgi:hypothetical protein
MRLFQIIAAVARTVAARSLLPFAIEIEEPLTILGEAQNGERFQFLS